MNIFKNSLNICIDNFYENANLLINSFEPSYTTLFLFTPELLPNEDFMECFPETQIYTSNINSYLEKIFNLSINKPQYNKVIFFTGIPIQLLDNCKFYKNILDTLTLYNVTIFLHLTDYRLINFNIPILNFFLPRPLQIDTAKRFSMFVNVNWYNFMMNYNNLADRVVFRKNNGWTPNQLTPNITCSKYVFPVLDDTCKSNTTYTALKYLMKQKEREKILKEQEDARLALKNALLPLELISKEERKKQSELINQAITLDSIKSDTPIDRIINMKFLNTNKEKINLEDPEKKIEILQERFLLENKIKELEKLDEDTKQINKFSDIELDEKNEKIKTILELLKSL
jgi:hypothetical protein